MESFIGKVFFKLDPQFLKQHDPLERMRVLLALLDNPQNKFKSVLVGGTSGKGSTAYFTSHILTTAGYKTGLTISPHLQRINERIQINGKAISDNKFVKLTTSMIRIIEVMKKMEVGAPSYFEILIAMAFLFFAREKVDIAVVEVGMGGEYDATNTLYPLIAVLTNVSLDHTNVLGKTVEKIARTKAGIIKGLINNSSFIINHLVVITGAKQPSVIKIIEERVRKVGAKLLRLGKDFGLTNFKVSLLGDYQKENASLAIETVRELRDCGFKISENAIRKALQTAFFPGRFEIIKLKIENCELKIVLDGAHNPAKMEAFLQSLKKIFPKARKIFVVAFKEDKNIKAMINKIFKVADVVIFTRFQAKTDMSVSASADALKIKYQILKIKNTKRKIEIFYINNSKKALQKALNILMTQYPNVPSIVVVTGSLYLVGEVRDFLK